MLVLPILLPILLDDLVDGILLDFERAIAHRRRSPVCSIWMRVRLIESSPGALIGLHLRRSPRTEADADMEFDVDLDLGSSNRLTYSNEAHLKTTFVLHWVGRELRRRMKDEGRELAHLPAGELDDLLERMADAAREPGAWTYRLDELVTFHAAVLERECRDEEARCDTAFHAEALELGATDEGAPGVRGDPFFMSYFRDLDGNMICGFHQAEPY